MIPGNVLKEAEFDSAVRSYIFTVGVVCCLVTVVGVIFLPIWLVGLGSWYASESLRRMTGVLTDKALHIRFGVFFRTERNIPLDKIQDLTIKQGPLMRAFGISLLKVETAGQSAQPGTSEGSLLGVVDAREFRDAVLAERDRVIGVTDGSSVAAALQSVSQEEILLEIRDTLIRIEAALARGDE